MALKTHLTKEEVDQLIEAAGNLRDRLVIRFLFYSGCRVSELVGIKLEDIDWEGGKVMIQHLKRSGAKKICPQCDAKSGRRADFCPKCGHDLSRAEVEGGAKLHRIVHIDRATMEMAKEYIRNRDIADDRLVPVTRQMVYYILRDAASESEMEGKILVHPVTGKKHHISPHKMRDAHSVHWMEKVGNDVAGQKQLQSQLGHQSFDTTARYLKYSDDEVAETHRRVFEE